MINLQHFIFTPKYRRSLFANQLTHHERWLLHKAHSFANSEISHLELLMPDDFEPLDGFEWCLHLNDLHKDA